MAGNNRSILVVDDNDDVRRLVKKVLLMSGFQVIEAASGDEALEAVEKKVPDLILMDIRLPGQFNGLETTSRLKDDSRMQRVPVVALTASVLDRDRRQALAAGCSGFISKPIDISGLAELVEKYIQRGVMAPR
ncbi:MAG: response regulator [Thermoleophilia bacterium]|nr:response regulator [Thermoleophilia bacterium]